MKTDHLPWEAYTLIPTPPPHYSRNRFTPVFLVLAIIAIVTGGLIAWSNF